MHHFELELKKENPFLKASCMNGVIPKELSHYDFKKVPWKVSYAFLKDLAAHGTISWEGKKLIIDLFSKVPFYYEVDKKEDGTLILSGKLKLKNETDLSLLKFISPSFPTWFIYENSLKVIATEAGFKELLELPRTIDGSELQELQKENDPEVRILFAGIAQNDPIPMLILSERTGAFANLFMDYGQGPIPFLKGPCKTSEEHWEKDLTETGYRRKIVDNSHYYCPLDQVGKSLAFLLEIGWKVQDAKKQEVLLESKRDLQVEDDENGLILKGDLTFGNYKADLKKVFGAFNKRDRFIELGDGKLGLVLEGDVLSSLADEMDLSKEVPTLKRHQAGLLPDVYLPASLKFLTRSRKEPISPSPLFNGFLRPYQQEGLSWLHHLYETGLNGILADDMGLGKTIQVLAFLSLQNPDQRHLVIVPTSLLFNWEREIEKFLPKTPVHRHHGATKREQLPEKGIILTSYYTLRSDIDLFEAIAWDSIILDEAHIVKNSSSLTAVAIYRLKGTFRLAMTGTVIENHSSELWAHFHFLMPGMLGPKEDFERKLSLGQVDSRHTRVIQQKISPFILRRKKEAVAQDLPSLEEQIAFIEMTPAQQNAYDSFLAASRKGSKKNRLEIFEVLLRLRQITCSPLLISHLLENPTHESGKMDALFLDLETIREEGKKALIFSQFTSMLHLIGKKLKEENIPYCLLEGSTIDREQPVQTFQEDPNVPFFLISLKAGGVGLNLTAADYVLLYDPWWHEAAEAQAIARAHRIGQKKPVIAKRYITVGSVEEKMMTLKKAKISLFKNLLEGELQDNLFTEEELDFLLS